MSKFDRYKLTPLRADVDMGMGSFKPIINRLVESAFEAAKRSDVHLLRGLLADQPKQYHIEQVIYPLRFSLYKQWQHLTAEQVLYQGRVDLLEGWLNKDQADKELRDAFTLDELDAQLNEVWIRQQARSLQQFEDQWRGRYRRYQKYPRLMEGLLLEKCAEEFCDFSYIKFCDYFSVEATVERLRESIKKGETNNIDVYWQHFNDQLATANALLKEKKQELKQINHYAQQTGICPKTQTCEDDIIMLEWSCAVLDRILRIINGYLKEPHQKVVKTPLTITELQYQFNNYLDLVIQSKQGEIREEMRLKNRLGELYYRDAQGELVQCDNEDKLAEFINEVEQYMREQLNIEFAHLYTIDDDSSIEAVLKQCCQQNTYFKQARHKQELMDRYFKQMENLREEQEYLQETLRECRTKRFRFVVNEFGLVDDGDDSLQDQASCQHKLDSLLAERGSKHYPIAHFIIKQFAPEDYHEGHYTQQQLQQIESVIYHGFPVDSRDENGEHLLHIIARQADSESLALLYFRGAEVTAKHPLSDPNDECHVEPIALIDTNPDYSCYKYFKDQFFKLTKVYDQDPNLAFKLREFSGEINDSVVNYMVCDAQRGFWQRLLQTSCVRSQRNEECKALNKIAWALADVERINTAYQQLFNVNQLVLKASRGSLTSSQLYESFKSNAYRLYQLVSGLVETLDPLDKQELENRDEKQRSILNKMKNCFDCYKKDCSREPSYTDCYEYFRRQGSISNLTLFTHNPVYDRVASVFQSSAASSLVTSESNNSKSATLGHACNDDDEGIELKRVSQKT